MEALYYQQPNGFVRNIFDFSRPTLSKVDPGGVFFMRANAAKATLQRSQQFLRTDLIRAFNC
jgi:hypothetical protein